MWSLVLIFLLSYLVGCLPTYRPNHSIAVKQGISADHPLTLDSASCPRWVSRADYLTFVTESIKAAACLLMARQLVGTSVSSVIASLGVIWGSMWHPWSRTLVIHAGLGASATCLFVLCPPSFAAALIMWLVAAVARKSTHGATILSSSVLPLTTFFLRKPDIVVIFGIFLGASLIYRSLCEMEGTTAVNRPQTFSVRPISTLLRRAALLATLFLVLFFIYATHYVYHGMSAGTDLLRAGNPNLKVVALTFDDGPDPRYTPEILDILERYQVKATFFMVGRHVKKYPGLARRVAEQGHEIGNHTYSHLNLFEAKPDVVEREILKCESTISDTTHTNPQLFRPPRGLSSPESFRTAQQLGYTVVLWSNSSEDWAEVSVSDITRNVLEKAKGGDIILFHDSGDLIHESGGTRINTVRALPVIIEELKRRGFSFVTVSEMMRLSHEESVGSGDDGPGALHPERRGLLHPVPEGVGRAAERDLGPRYLPGREQSRL